MSKPATSLSFTTADQIVGAPRLIVIGSMERLRADEVTDHLPERARDVWSVMLDSAKPRDSGDVATTWVTGGDEPLFLAAIVLPESCSRHMGPARTHVITELLSKAGKRGEQIGILAALEDPGHVLAVAAAIARAFPLYSTKQPKEEGAARARAVSVAFTTPDGPIEADARTVATADAVRVAQKLVDMPTSELRTDDFVAAARAVADEVGATVEVIRGEELRDRGLGGLWGVGKAATAPPALVILSHRPEGASRKVCWVGKGIVYDTGGLSIKTSAHMPGMKRDMGGAAAVLGAFQAAVKSGSKDNIDALLCLAENAVGPEATRPDDILHMYSGKTVEVNNTDAEGRLVLADGVAYAAKHLDPDVLIDIATLTGAQMIATGKLHAALFSNDEALELAAVAAGQRSGDLCHPMLFAPEIFRSEIESEVADMKNSVKDRMNASSSCAAQFIAEHLVDYDKPWLHIDMAGPVHSGERATGYGVALLVELLG